VTQLSPGVPPARTPEEVRRALAEQIGSGRLRPGQRLGAERALAADGEPIEFSRDLFRADRTRIVVRTEGGGPRAVPGRARVVELHAQEAV